MPATAPIHLKVRDVALAAKKAYDEGRLSAQGPTPTCKYRDESGRPCAVGAALSDKQAALLPNSTRINCIRVEDHGALVTSDDFTAIAALQSGHDRWSLALAHNEGPGAAETGEGQFIRTLTSILTKTEA